jgi:hypothetical protein
VRLAFRVPVVGLRLNNWDHSGSFGSFRIILLSSSLVLEIKERPVSSFFQALTTRNRLGVKIARIGCCSQPPAPTVESACASCPATACDQTSAGSSVLPLLLLLTVIQQAFHSTAREFSFNSESLPSLTVSLCISSPQAYDAESSFNNFSLFTTYPFQLTSSSVRDDRLMRLKPSSLMSNTEPRIILFPFIIWVTILSR